MISDLDETLKQLLVQKAELDPAEIDVSFDVPTRDWSAPVTRPTVNLYLYDIRENTKLRETYWDEPSRDNGRGTVRRFPLRIDLSYMVTCWTSVVEDQHRLLWRVLDTLFRHSPLPDDILQGDLRQLIHPVRTEIAQSEDAIINVSDFWAALDNQLRPSINLLVTLDLDLNELRSAPLVFARAAKVGRQATLVDREGNARRLDQLASNWEAMPLEVGGYVQRAGGEPVSGVAVRLIAVREHGRPGQVGPTRFTEADGRYLFRSVPPGEYTLVVESPGRPPQQQALTLAARERGEPLPALIHVVEVAPPEG